VGLAPVSVLWRYAELQAWDVCASPMVFLGTQGGASAEVSVQGMQADVLGALAVPGTRELVCTGGAPVGDRPLAAYGQFPTSHSGASALVVGEARAVAIVASA